MTRDTEQLLRSVLNDPAFDLTPDGDPLAPVWGKARAIRRRRALTASGTVIVVAAAAVLTGIAVTRPDARRGGVVTQPTPSQAPSNAPTPPPATAPYTSVPLAMTEPVAFDQGGTGAVLGVQQGSASFRLVRFDVGTGAIVHSPVVQGTAGAIATDDSTVWVPVVGTPTMRRFTANGLVALSDVTDPRGVLLGPNVATRYGAWAADTQGLSLFMADRTSPRGDARRGMVCSLTPIAEARNATSDTPFSNGFLATTSDGGAPCTDLRIGTGPNALGGIGAPDLSAEDRALGLGEVAGRSATGGTWQIWVVHPTGTMGFAQTYTMRSADGALVTQPGHINGSNQLQISLAGGIAWFSDPGSLGCVGRDGGEAWHQDLPHAHGTTHVFDFSGTWVTVDLATVNAFDPSVCPAAG